MTDQNKKGGVKKIIHTVTQAWHDARRFYGEELWDMDVSTLPRLKKAGTTFLRVIGIVIKGLITDRCTLQASALTYFTLMSMVPVLAMMLAVAKGLGAKEALMDKVGLERVQAAGEGGGYVIVEGSKLAELPPEATSMITQAADVILGAVESASFGTIGAIGLAVLFWSVIKVMGKIENTFNDIWGVKEARTMVRKFSDYISVLVLVPIMVLMATSINAVLTSGKVAGLLQSKIGPLYYLYEKLLGLSGVSFLFLAFMCLYMFMPNTRVKLFPALIGGIVGGGIWYLWQGVYFFLQVEAGQKNAVYGTFAAIPLFLFWVYLSWVIVLFGAEIAFAVQNHRTYAQEQAAKDATFATRQMLTIIIMFEVCRDYYRGARKWDPYDFSMENGIPIRLVKEALKILTDNRVLLQTEDGSFVPGKDLSKLTLADAEHALVGEISPSVRKTIAHEHNTLHTKFKNYFDQFNESLADISLRDLVLEAES
ncbi:MAG: YihY/virulence factor BrkB family protein [Lentisphaeria bacterium]